MAPNNLKTKRLPTSRNACTCRTYGSPVGYAHIGKQRAEKKKKEELIPRGCRRVPHRAEVYGTAAMFPCAARLLKLCKKINVYLPIKDCLLIL